MSAPTKREWAVYRHAQIKIVEMYQDNPRDPDSVFNDRAMPYIHGDEDEGIPALKLSVRLRIGLGDFAEGICEYLKAVRK